jgi:hypothetical protein
MLGPRIESFGIQRRRAVSAHQGALHIHGAGSVACDLSAPLIHVKAITALSPRCTSVSTTSNEALTSSTSHGVAAQPAVAPRQTRGRAAATLNGRSTRNANSPNSRYMCRINRTEIP